MSTKNKSKIIEKILSLTKREGEVFFDRLSDHPIGYLEKLLKVISALK